MVFVLDRSIDERTLVYFADNSHELLEAYVESGEGIDRAGGFAVQVSSYQQTSYSDHKLSILFRALAAHWYAKSTVIITTLLASPLRRSSNY